MTQRRKNKNVNNLDHQNHKYQSLEESARAIKSLCGIYDQQHYLERKIKFLLDVRGYLKLNKIRGNYIEFGCYMAEMQYAAYNIFKNLDLIDN